MKRHAPMSDTSCAHLPAISPAVVKALAKPTGTRYRGLPLVGV
jgi:hypothetical protein